MGWDVKQVYVNDRGEEGEKRMKRDVIYVNDAG